ncbi:MAG TPA: hypothetical protein DDW52_16020 [Planctomycetaceae bacterium]|nr:hypothetical protein [Planctomycetaceae bacterium]
MPDLDWQAILGPVLGNGVAGGISSGELEDFEQSVFRIPPRSVRLAPDCLVELPFETLPVAWLDSGRELVDSSIRPGAYLQHAAGCYYVQDAASMLAVALCDVQPGQQICDLCAAPGGKSTALAELLCGDGWLLANEVIHSRLGVLTAALARTGKANYLVSNQDSQALAGATGSLFDCVLVDAPCSGQSMVARGKQSMASFTTDQVAHSAARQHRIVGSAAKMVRPGGRLVYSTCTFAYEENEAIIEPLLESGRWQPAPIPSGLEQYASPVAAGCYRLWPHRDRCAGGFAAALVSTGHQQADIDTQHPRHSKWQCQDDLPEDVAEWFRSDAALPFKSSLYNTGERLELIPSAAIDNCLGIAYSGVPIASVRHAAGARLRNAKPSGLNLKKRGKQGSPPNAARYEPAYASAILDDVLPARRSVELTDAQAIRFVSGEPIRDAINCDPGWCVVHWRNRPLAWGKFAGGILKNHLPKPLRQSGCIADR